MKFLLHAKDLKLSQDEKDYIEEKVNILKRYAERVDDDASECKVDVIKTHHASDDDQIEMAVTMHLPGHATLRAEAHSKTVTAAIDMVEEKLKPQIERYKAQVQSKI